MQPPCSELLSRSNHGTAMMLTMCTLHNAERLYRRPNKQQWKASSPFFRPYISVLHVLKASMAAFTGHSSGSLCFLLLLCSGARPLHLGRHIHNAAPASSIFLRADSGNCVAATVTFTFSSPLPRTCDKKREHTQNACVASAQAIPIVCVPPQLAQEALFPLSN